MAKAYKLKFLKRRWCEARAVFWQALRQEKGATAVEYGLVIAGIALAIILLIFAMGDSLEGQFSDYSAKVSARP
jgi:pilus assembly protein Flp/PilA